MEQCIGKISDHNCRNTLAEVNDRMVVMMVLEEMKSGLISKDHEILESLDHYRGLVNGILNCPDATLLAHNSISTVDMDTWKMEYTIRGSEVPSVVAAADIQKKSQVMITYGECMTIPRFIKILGKRCKGGQRFSLQEVNEILQTERGSLCYYMSGHVWVIRTHAFKWVRQHCDKNNIGKRKKKRKFSAEKNILGLHRPFLKHTVCKVDDRYCLCLEPLKLIKQGEIMNVDWNIKEVPDELQKYVSQVTCTCARCFDGLQDFHVARETHDPKPLHQTQKNQTVLNLLILS
jgi:hypothetical protein